MVMFHSFLYVYRRVDWTWDDRRGMVISPRCVRVKLVGFTRIQWWEHSGIRNQHEPTILGEWYIYGILTNYITWYMYINGILTNYISWMIYHDIQ